MAPQLGDQGQVHIFYATGAQKWVMPVVLKMGAAKRKRIARYQRFLLVLATWPRGHVGARRQRRARQSVEPDARVPRKRDHSSQLGFAKNTVRTKLFQRVHAPYHCCGLCCMSTLNSRRLYNVYARQRLRATVILYLAILNTLFKSCGVKSK